MDYILYEQNGNVATITINREKALNALNSQVLDELNATLLPARDDTRDLRSLPCCSGLRRYGNPWGTGDA